MSRQPTDEQLRPVLELAFEVAKAGTRMRPPVSPPEVMRKAMRAARLPNAELGNVRRALDGDEAFRARVAAAAADGAELLGELGTVWLTRPDGWRRRVSELLQAAAVPGAAVEGTEDAALRRLERRREAAEQAAQRSQAELAVVRHELRREQSRRAAAEDERDQARRRAESAEAQAAAAQRRLAAVEEAAGGESERWSADLAAAERRVAELEEELAMVAAVRDELLAERADVDAAAAAVRRASGSIARLAGSLQEVASAIVPPPPAARRAARVPIAIPPGLTADSVEATRHLLRVPGVVAIVDGYNVAKLGWPDLALEDQRERCLDAVDDLVRRLLTRIVVVFDGADVVVPVRRRLARVVFSPAGTIADDVVRDEVGALPVAVPVVVVTDDRELAASVRAKGATVVRSAQLLALARR
jgi:hypothetical protein